MTPVTKRPRRAAAGTSPMLVTISGGLDMEVIVKRPDESEPEPEPEWRNWAGLLPDLVTKIGDHLLLDDVADYIRLRAICRPWRGSTEDPKALEPRFFPRNWLLLAGYLLRTDGEPERLLNVRTGAVLRVRIPDPDEYTHHCNAEGLLVLHHGPTDVVCLLNPLTLAFTDLSAMSAVYDVARPGGREDPDEIFFSDGIRAAGVVVDVDELGRAVAPPVVVLSLTVGLHTAIVCTEPCSGGSAWRAVSRASFFTGGLAVRGRFYVTTRAGDVLTVDCVELNMPRLRYVACMNGDLDRVGFNKSSCLVPSLDDGDCGMLLVHARSPDGRLGCTKFSVDLTNGSLVAMQRPSDVTVFLPSVTLQSSAFPAVKKDAVHFEGCYMRRLLRGDYIPSSAATAIRRA